MNVEIDKIFNTLKPKLRNGDFDWCDKYLSEIRISEQKEDILIAMLVSTLDWKNQLKNRYIFYITVKNHLLRTNTKDEVLKMLEGLGYSSNGI